MPLLSMLLRVKLMQSLCWKISLLLDYFQYITIDTPGGNVCGFSAHTSLWLFILSILWVKVQVRFLSSCSNKCLVNQIRYPLIKSFILYCMLPPTTLLRSNSLSSFPNILIELDLPNGTNNNTGYPVKYEVQINDECFSISMSLTLHET